jgi:biopolymer transport protein ExbB/biopolymer transport protein TolQ
VELWQTMGWFARGIVLMLFLMSAFAGSIAIRKGLMLARAVRASRGFSPRLAAALDARDYAAAQRALEAHPHSHLAHLVAGVFPALLRRHAERALDLAGVDRSVEINLLSEIAGFRRGLGGLATVAATAPFVGLLGTVMGIVNAFTSIASSGSSGLAAISAGIAEALVTTALGLLVAIPAVWLYNYFVNRIEFLAMEMTVAGKELADALQRHEDEAGDARGKGQGYAAAGS